MKDEDLQQRELSIPLALSRTGDSFYASEFTDAQTAAQLNRIHHFLCPCCEERLIVARDRVGLHFKHDAYNPSNTSCPLYSGENDGRIRRWRSLEEPQEWQKRFPQSVGSSQNWMRAGFRALVENYAVDVRFELAIGLSNNRRSFRLLCSTEELVKEFETREYLSQPQRHLPSVADTSHSQRAQLLWRHLRRPSEESCEIRRLLFLVAASRASAEISSRMSVETDDFRRLMKTIAYGKDADLDRDLVKATDSEVHRAAGLICAQAAYLIHHFPFIEAHREQLLRDYGEYVAKGAGYVYFIVDTSRDGWAKVGISNDPPMRARKLETATPGQMLVLDSTLCIGGSTSEHFIRSSMRRVLGGESEREWLHLNGTTIGDALALFRKLSHDQILMDAAALPKVQGSPLISKVNTLLTSFGRRW